MVNVMFKKINKYLIFSFIISFIVLLITSKNSFLYCFNDWVDANAFFTVGKSWFNNVIPYKEIFEQKGPLLYLIYGIGYLLSNKSFHGVFILEVIIFTIFLYFVYKIFKIYFNEKYTIILLPLVAFLITISSYFVHGGSCEEFCLPFISCSLYYYFKHFKERKLNNKEIFINGLLAGAVLLMKYTVLGFWIGFCLFIVIDYLRNKEYKNILVFCFIFLLGMILPFLIFAIYFIFNNAFKEFIDVYFILNMTSYTNIEKTNFIMRILEIINYSISILNIEHLFIYLLLVLLLSFALENNNKYFTYSLFGLILFTVFFIFFGLKSFTYYHLPVYFFIVFLNIIFVLLIFKKYIKKYINLLFKTKFIIIYLIILSLFLFLFSDNKNYLFKTEEDFVQYKYSNYISKYDNPTLLNMGFLDIGVYTLSGVVPNTRFFEVQNFSYDKFKDNIDEMNNYIKNKKVKFIVYSDTFPINVPDYLYDNYKLVYEDIYIYESRSYTSYLFELKDI